jgi:hypothetical protein
MQPIKAIMQYNMTPADPPQNGQAPKESGKRLQFGNSPEIGRNSHPFCANAPASPSCLTRVQ